MYSLFHVSVPALCLCSSWSVYVDVFSDIQTPFAQTFHDEILLPPQKIVWSFQLIVIYWNLIVLCLHSLTMNAVYIFFSYLCACFICPISCMFKDNRTVVPLVIFSKSSEKSMLCASFLLSIHSIENLQVFLNLSSMDWITSKQEA